MLRHAYECESDAEALTQLPTTSPTLDQLASNVQTLAGAFPLKGEKYGVDIFQIFGTGQVNLSDGGDRPPL